jgi:hypothetical protein
MYRTPVSPARQDGFDQIPAHIQRRDDLTSGAKRLYGLLCSVQRMKVERDYRWLAAELAASVRSIVRWVQQLVAAGLVAVRRRGQGLTNLFVVLALGTSGMDTPATPRVTGSQPPARAGTYGPVKNPTGGKNRGTGQKRNGDDRPRCARCPHQEHGTTCSRCGCRDYGAYTRTREGRYELRDGRMVLVPHLR